MFNFFFFVYFVCSFIRPNIVSNNQNAFIRVMWPLVLLQRVILFCCYNQPLQQHFLVHLMLDLHCPMHLQLSMHSYYHCHHFHLVQMQMTLLLLLLSLSERVKFDQISKFNVNFEIFKVKLTARRWTEWCGTTGRCCCH